MNIMFHSFKALGFACGNEEKQLQIFLADLDLGKCRHSPPHSQQMLPLSVLNSLSSPSIVVLSSVTTNRQHRQIASKTNTLLLQFPITPTGTHQSQIASSPNRRSSLTFQSFPVRFKIERKKGCEEDRDPTRGDTRWRFQRRQLLCRLPPVFHHLNPLAFAERILESFPSKSDTMLSPILEQFYQKYKSNAILEFNLLVICFPSSLAGYSQLAVSDLHTFICSLSNILQDRWPNSQKINLGEE